jgi:hypothetical protein
MENGSHSGSEGDDEMEASEAENEPRIVEAPRGRESFGADETTIVNIEDDEMGYRDDNEDEDSGDELDDALMPLPDDQDDESLDPEIGGENDPLFDQDAFDKVWASVLDRQADEDYSQEELDAEWLSWFQRHGGANSAALLGRARRGLGQPRPPSSAGNASRVRSFSFAEQLQGAMALQALHEDRRPSAPSNAQSNAALRHDRVVAEECIQRSQNVSAGDDDMSAQALGQERHRGDSNERVCRNTTWAQGTGAQRDGLHLDMSEEQNGDTTPCPWPKVKSTRPNKT